MNTRSRNPDRHHFFSGEIIILLVAWFLSFIILIALEQVQSWIEYDRVSQYQEGDYAKSDFSISRDFYFIDKEATEQLITLNRNLANPVYIVHEKITKSVLEAYDRFFNMYMAVVSGNISPIERDVFQKQYPAIANLDRNEEQMEFLLNKLRDILYGIQNAGIFSVPRSNNESLSGMIELVRMESQPGKRILIPPNSILHLANLSQYIEAMPVIQNMNSGDRKFILVLASYFAKVNTYISEDLTEENKRIVEANTLPVVISIKAGEQVLQSGTVVTETQAKIIRSLQQQRKLNWPDLLKSFLFMAIIFVFGLVSARNFSIKILERKTLYIYIALLGSYFLLAAPLSILLSYPPFLNVGLLLPTALIVLLINQLLGNRRLAALSAILMAMLVFFLTNGDVPGFFITLASGLGGTLSNRRYQSGLMFLRMGLRLAVIMGGAALFTGFWMNMTLHSIFLMFILAAGNGMLTGILSLIVLPVLGWLLNVATAFRLSELSDPNVPILKRMRLQAPGTFIHSQNVAQLSEAACDAIGANGLLARVGAYYHDIGKIDQPQFFVENQTDENKHDDMNAGLSAAVIRSHVKIGIEKGREIHLPQEVLDIIEQHHGTSIIQYFYSRAIENNDNGEIPAGGFSYEGPKPQSREAAVVMLADGAEAVARALKDPTPAKLEKCIQDIIVDRFNSGELNESGIIAGDFEIIKTTFVHILRGYFHARIEYPKNKTTA